MQSVSCYLRNSVSTETHQSTDSGITGVQDAINRASESVSNHKNQMKNNFEKMRELLKDFDSGINEQKEYFYRCLGHRLVLKKFGINEKISSNLAEYEQSRKEFIEKLDSYQPKVDEGLACESDLVYGLVYVDTFNDILEVMQEVRDTYLSTSNRIILEFNEYIERMEAHFQERLNAAMNDPDW